jgi:hypothetical protein
MGQEAYSWSYGTIPGSFMMKNFIFILNNPMKAFRGGFSVDLQSLYGPWPTHTPEVFLNLI